MNDTVKIQQPVATTVYANVPVETTMLATNIYGPAAQMAAPTLIATGPPQGSLPPLQVAAQPPNQHQQLIALAPQTHIHAHAAHAGHPHTAAAVAAATAHAQQTTLQAQQPQQVQVLQYAPHQPPPVPVPQASAVTTTTIDNTEYAVMNGAAIAQDGTVICYGQPPEDMGAGASGTNLVAVEQMSGTAAAATAGVTHPNTHLAAKQPHHVIVTNGPPPGQQQQQQQQQAHQAHVHQHVVVHGGQQQQQQMQQTHLQQQQQVQASTSGAASSGSTGNNNASSTATENADIPLDKLKQLLSTQLEYYFSR